MCARPKSWQGANPSFAVWRGAASRAHSRGSSTWLVQKAFGERAPRAGFRAGQSSASARCMRCSEPTPHQPLSITAALDLPHHASTRSSRHSARIAPNRCPGSVNSTALLLTCHASLFDKHNLRCSKRLRLIGGSVGACACSDPIPVLLKANAAAMRDPYRASSGLLQDNLHTRSVRTNSRSLPVRSFDRPSVPRGLKS